MFLSKEEKILVLLFRLQEERRKTLFKEYPSYDIGERRIQRLKKKIEKLGGNTEVTIEFIS